MQSLKLFQARSLLLPVLLFFATATTACAQEKPKRMIPGPSVKELVAESFNEKEDGIAQITIGQLFKPGSTEYTRIGAAGLKDAPPLPTGFVLFKDLVYSIKTEAVISGFQLTVFNLPSAENENAFNRLNVLHLEYDSLSPSGYSWAPVTIFPDGWSDHFHFVSKNQYDALVPNFKSKRIAASTEQLGTFAIALAPEFETQGSQSFPEVTVTATSSPEPVQGGREVTHIIRFANKGSTAAAEVNFKEVLDPSLAYISADQSQGICKQKEASNIIVCHLGVLAGGAQATITVVSRARAEVIWKDRIELTIPIEVVFKESATDFVDERGQIFTQFRTTVMKRE